MTRLFAVEDQLKSAIDASKAGDFDGDEVAVDGSDGFLYLYGPDADRLFDVVLPILKSADFMKGAKVRCRYGPPDDSSREIVTTISE